MSSFRFPLDGLLSSLLALVFPNIDSYQQVYELELFYLEHVVALLAVYILYL